MATFVANYYAEYIMCGLVIHVAVCTKPRASELILDLAKMVLYKMKSCPVAC